MGEERRRHPRYETEFAVIIELLEPPAQTFRDIARLHDISNSGLSFISERTSIYSIGQRLSATVQPPEDATDSGISMRARATIVWVKPLQQMPKSVQIGVNLDEWVNARALVD